MATLDRNRNIAEWLPNIKLLCGLRLIYMSQIRISKNVAYLTV